MITRKVPMRKCVGCNEMKTKKELVRVVRSKDGEVSLDLTGKKPGRGAYLCRDISCLKKARKSRRIETALGVSISSELYDSMEEEIQGE